MQRSISAATREQLTTEIAQLHSFSLDQLRLRWRQLFGADAPPRFSRDLLLRAAAYRLQERVLGGLRPATRRLLRRVAEQARARKPIRVAPVRKLEPGAILVREWQGTKYQVVILEHGVSFRQQHYRSLSEVARVITGSRWSGPLFFGLKRRSEMETVGGK